MAVLRSLIALDTRSFFIMLARWASIGAWITHLTCTADRALLALGKTRVLATSNFVNLFVTIIGVLVGRYVDMAVNPTKEKKLTNMRATGTDKNILLKPARQMSLEMALEYIAEDELLEVTPTKIRLRKKILKETDRRRLARQGG